MSISSRFEAIIDTDVSAAQAWQALEAMSQWLTTLHTVRNIEPEGDGGAATARLAQGFRYRVVTPEGAVMRCTVLQADPTLLRAQITASVGPLRSRLICSIRSNGPDSCTLRRQQSYLGPIGWAFALIFHRREQAETINYLHAWAAYAERHPHPELDA